MLEDRSKLEGIIVKKNKKIIYDTESMKRLSDLCQEKYDIPRSYISDIISMRTDIDTVSIFVLFAMLECYCEIEGSKENLIKKYFTNIEIENFKKSKFHVDKLQFPLVFDMIQIADDQWIGVINVDTIIKMAKAQIIHYDINTQRTMQRIVKGNKVSYKIKLDNNAVASISNMMEEERYISNTLTLNIPPESESDFYYDKDKKQLVINKLDHFNITDGYHRYISIGKVKDKKPDFNINMELRITNFYDDKAQNFIFQEDQKTKMAKVDSDSFNNYNPANIIASRLNEDPRSNLKGLVNRNDAIIPSQDLANVIQYFYVGNNVSKSEKQKLIISTTKELIEDFNLLTEEHPDILERRQEFKDICCIVYIFKRYQEKDKTHMCDAIKYLMSNVDKINKKKFARHIMGKSIESDFNKIMEGAEF